MTKFLKNNIRKSAVLFIVILVLLTPTLALLTPHDVVFADWSTELGHWAGKAMIEFSAYVAGLGGLLLKNAFQMLVFDMTKTFLSDGTGNIVNQLWQILRDFSNLLFIFGFIYIGFRTILDIDSAQTKRTFAAILIGAFLINFSLFFVKIVVDFGNLTAVEIYNAMFAGAKGDIAGAIMNQMGLVSILDGKYDEAFTNFTSGGNVSFYIAASLFLLIAGFVLAAGAILIVIRYVVLIFLMIFSPFMFAGFVFPQTGVFARMLWSKLIGNALFAPVYLLFIFMSLKVLEVLKGMTDIRTFREALVRPVQHDSIAVITNFLIATFFLILSLQVSKAIGAAGGDKAVSFGKSLASRGRQALYGAAAFTAGAVAGGVAGTAAATGRATLGRRAYRLANDDNDLKERAKSSWFAKQRLNMNTAIADASFDARKVGGVGKKLGIGEGQKGGYATSLKNIEKKEMDFAKKLGEVDDTDRLVKERKVEVDNLEKKLKAAKDKLNDTSAGPEKDKARAEVDKLDGELKKARETFSREKQRRVLGSTYTADEIDTRREASNAQIEASTATIQRRWAEYKKEVDPAKRAEHKKVIQEQTKEIQEARKELRFYKGMKSTDGYAQKLKNSTRWSWFQGRLVDQQRRVGEEMEKAYTKKIKKSKEDERSDSLIDAVKSIKT